jgi:peroxiredoxin Q/BCP
MSIPTNPTKDLIMALLTEGEQAPAFSLPNQDGSAVELASLAGKNVLMWWYPKADTPG